ncbi:unnamed protein product [Microthlaspi erraticum]|uniref:Uncharacterized protein n=1 Tax=Microthlaspi erraticum TaxID=1685480 RepID=A0A6D2K023_9BRAS|nr:unnamed protein product [Microthlaspi erraticum]
MTTTPGLYVIGDSPHGSDGNRLEKKRSYNQKSEDCPDGSIEKTAPNRAVRLAEKLCSRSAKVTSVRLKSRPKFKPTGRSRNTTRETLSRGRPSTTVTPRRARPCRASREQASRPRNPSRTTADASVRAGNPRPAENHRPNLIRSTTPADHESSGHDRSDSAHDPTVRPIVPTDRPNAAVDPKPVLKPDFIFSSPA